MSAMEDPVVRAWLDVRESRRLRIKAVEDWIKGLNYGSMAGFPEAPDYSMPVSRREYQQLELMWRSDVLDFLMTQPLIRRSPLALTEPRLQHVCSKQYVGKPVR